MQKELVLSRESQFLKVRRRTRPPTVQRTREFRGFFVFRVNYIEAAAFVPLEMTLRSTRISQKTRGVFGRDGVDIKAGAPFKTGDLGEAGQDVNAP